MDITKLGHLKTSLKIYICVSIIDLCLDLQRKATLNNHVIEKDILDLSFKVTKLVSNDDEDDENEGDEYDQDDELPEDE